MIKSNYIELLDSYEVVSKLRKEFWSEIVINYSKDNRYYHTLQHLQDLYDQLVLVKDKIENWNVVLFTLYYHDIIYKSTRKDNEEKSAKFASKRMTEIGMKEDNIKLCFDQIIATKSHKYNLNKDTNYFTDADLSILGREPDSYKTYCQNIRNEYSIYPKFLYNRGRKKVINHFLSMNRIFKTQTFYNKFERQARLNLNEELNILG